MSSQAQIRSELDQLFELNHLFLCYLRQLAPADAEALGLPGAARIVLDEADEARIDAAAKFPQSLFRLNLSDAAAGRDGPTRGDDHAQRALQLTVLLCAWNQCRRSEYAARLYLGLDNRVVRALRTTNLQRLSEIATQGDFLSCAYPGAAWFWDRLLQRQSIGGRRELALLGLQPKLAADWAPRSYRPLRLSV